ncbi:uncharacterized protein LTR77_005361 [Saxophila tyrrhenica]|uniref:VPS9 domain-containing protein n=1 Tax=Saxophila tyrrhenica TaxID=1690608 RepID=A0AAV9PAG7_9PEZI|nr:hypothetical protein LTR77_005361 [Saxophila tyrrhenica]
MATSPRRATAAERPSLNTIKSFSRMDETAMSPRRRANTLQDQGIPALSPARYEGSSPEMVGKKPVADVFENQDDDEEQQAETDTPGLQLPNAFDELPVEIRSLTQRFIESLSAKVHPTPLTADALSNLFQDFYERAAASIATHIASLSSRIGREKSPAPSNSSKASMKGRARAGSGAKRTESSPSNSGGEMLTASEVAHRRKARRLLDLKRLALEEAVEKSVSSDDDARDGKLRSRTAALALVGIGLKELHVDSPTNQEVRKATEEKEDEIHRSLAPAREALQRMDDDHYPLGKLQHLTDAHKSIVETLSQLFPSSSSADEILPTLIYTLITSPPEGINVVSNLNFIQRFRTASKVDGEAAYCLVNLEAAISFLETVDLSSLRADELPEGPPKSGSNPSTPTAEKTIAFPDRTVPTKAADTGVSQVTVESSDKSSSPNQAVKALPSAPRTPTGNAALAQQQRRISALVKAQTDRIEAGRDNILDTADKIYDSVHGSLENSLQFVFGRFKDRTAGDSPLPKTLEDARKLVSSPHPGDEDDSLNLSGRSSPAIDGPLNPRNDAKMLDLLGGKRQLRDRSADSARSGGSFKQVAWAAKQKEEPQTPSANLLATINTINPLNRFNVPGFGRFGRTGSLPTPSPAQPSPATEKPDRLANIVESPAGARANVSDTALLETQQDRDGDGDDLNAREALAELRKLKPPRKRFLEVQSAGELKIAEVDELLQEYRRLAKAIGEAIAT